MNYSGRTFTHNNKYGKIKGSFYFDEQREHEHPIITEFIRFCKNNDFPVDMCRLIESIEVIEGYGVNDCLRHYIKSITKRERYGITNDAILIKICFPHDHLLKAINDTINYQPNAQILEELENADFVPIDFIGHDPIVRYYAHKNGFVRALINKSKENK